MFAISDALRTARASELAPDLRPHAPRSHLPPGDRKGRTPFRPIRPRLYGQAQMKAGESDSGTDTTFLVERYWPGIDGASLEAGVRIQKRRRDRAPRLAPGRGRRGRVLCDESALRERPSRGQPAGAHAGGPRRSGQPARLWHRFPEEHTSRPGRDGGVTRIRWIAALSSVVLAALLMAGGVAYALRAPLKRVARPDHARLHPDRTLKP